MLTVKIIDNEKGSPAGKLADAELHFTAPSHSHTDAATCGKCAQALNGLKLIGFAIWERRGGGERNVTFPARQYSVNGERRSFALLRPIDSNIEAHNGVRQLILDAYARHERGEA